MNQDIPKLFAAFLQTYDVEKKNAIWQSHSQQFRRFWTDRIMSGSTDELEDAGVREASGFRLGEAQPHTLY
jgi:hypothetical protein